MKKTIKLIFTILISTALIIDIPLYSNALSFSEIIEAGDDFLKEGNDKEVITPDESQLQEISNTVSGVLLTIAFAVTFISIAMMGFNFAIQSAEDKAKVKESMVPWVIGIFVSFGAYGIWKMTMNIFYNLV